MSSAIPAMSIADAVALIDEERCIGCTLCIQACPVDAIVGAAKLMHAVIASQCTGCELCLAPCPVDCITMRRIETRDIGARREAEAEASRRFEARNRRLARAGEEHAAKLATRKKRETIAKVLERARQRLEGRKAQ